MLRNLQKKTIIIGGGISGLASAALLAKNGWDVTLLEKNSTVGGRARVLEKNNFAFDMGPSWYLMPEVFEKFFALFGKTPRDYYELIRLDPRYTVFFGNEKGIVLTDNREENVTLFENIEPGAGKKLTEFLAKMEQIYKASENLMYEDVWNMRTWTKKENIQSISTIIRKLKFWESWDAELSRYFKNEKLKKILGFPAVFLGGSPFNTPALYSILSWADFGKGVWYPKGGMGKVVDALVNLAQENGAKIVMNAEVTAIEVNDGKVTGVKTSDRYFETDIVIGATDIPMIETKLLPKNYQTQDRTYWEKKTLGISALLLYLGVNKKIEGLTHHNIYFSENWEKNFDEIFKQKTIPEDPSLYISVRSATDKTIVPKNSEEIFVLVPLGAGSYAEKDLKVFSKKIIDTVEKILGTQIKNNLVVKEIFTPKMFEEDYNAYQGTALGLAHTFNQSLFWRPHNKSKRVKGLYYAGQYTNPGVGVPMALISAQIVATMVGIPYMQTDKIFKKGSVTYYYSSLFFQGQAKKDVFSLYSYVRVIDDLVDNEKPQVQELEKMWKETLNEWSNGKSTNPIVRNFVELAKRKKFQWEWIESFWKAMRSDLKKKTYTGYAQLNQYMYGSAEVIGFMMARILDLPEEAMKAAALQGRAMQFVNFIRDVQEDKVLGRNYLGFTEGEEKNPHKWNEFLREHIEHYWTLQKEAEKGYKYIPKKYLIPIKTASDMYSWTAQQIYKNPMIVWKKKIKPSKFRILTQIIKNAINLP